MSKKVEQIKSIKMSSLQLSHALCFKESIYAFINTLRPVYVFFSFLFILTVQVLVKGKHFVFTDPYFSDFTTGHLFPPVQGATPGSNVFKAHVSFLPYRQCIYLQQVIKPW